MEWTSGFCAATIASGDYFVMAAAVRAAALGGRRWASRGCRRAAVMRLAKELWMTTPAGPTVAGVTVLARPISGRAPRPGRAVSRDAPGRRQGTGPGATPRRRAADQSSPASRQAACRRGAGHVAPARHPRARPRRGTSRTSEWLGAEPTRQPGRPCLRANRQPRYQRKCTKTRPKFLESFSTR
jgi:hypothetical protein